MANDPPSESENIQETTHPRSSRDLVETQDPAVQRTVLATLLAEIDTLTNLLSTTQAAIDRVWNGVCMKDPRIQESMKELMGKLFDANSGSPATNDKGKVNVSEYVNQAYRFLVGSLGSDNVAYSKEDKKRLFRRIAKMTHPDAADKSSENTTDYFRLACALDKADDFEGLSLLYYRLVGRRNEKAKADEQLKEDLEEEIDYTSELPTLIEFAARRVSALKRKISEQQNSLGYAALAEFQRGGDPIAVVLRMQEKWVKSPSFAPT